MKSIELRIHEHQIHAVFIYLVRITTELSVTTDSSGIPTKNATNTLYLFMPEASYLGLGLGLGLGLQVSCSCLLQPSQ